MAPELGIVHGSGIRDCYFWTFIIFVTNGVAMRDLDMMLLEILYLADARLFRCVQQCDFKRHRQTYNF